MPSTHVLERLRWPGSARQIAVFRIVLGVHLATIFMSPNVPLLLQLGSPEFPTTQSVFPVAFEEWVLPWLMTASHVGVMGSLLLAAGALTRVVAPVVLVCYVVTQNYYYRSTTAHDDWLYFTFCLLILCFARSSDALSIDSRFHKSVPRDAIDYRWPVELMLAWFGLLYTAAGLAKILPLRKGWVWLQGGTLEAVVISLIPDSPWHWIAGSIPFDYRIRWPWVLLSLGTVIVELGACSLWFSRRAAWPVFLSVLSLHLGIYVFGIAGFFWIALTFMPLIFDARAFGDVP